MSDKPKLKLVNWQDCMQVSASHFTQSDNYFIEALSDLGAVLRAGNSYGLLPAVAGRNGQISISEHMTGRISIELSSCNALTASGFRIRMNEDGTGSHFKHEFRPSEDKNPAHRNVDRWDIILAADPYKRQPSGELDPEEVPPRHPDSDYTYSISVMPKGEINTLRSARHCLVIGRIRKDSDRFVLDTNYIPPCAAMNSHPELRDYYTRFGELFNTLERTSKNIIEKIQRRSGGSELAANIHTICREMIFYIASFFFLYRNEGRMLPPVKVVGYVSTLAHIFYAAISTMKTVEKEALLKYFYEWTDVTPGSFEEMAVQTLEIIYEHEDIRGMMVRCESFLGTLAELWERMSRLEYIGQHKENIVVSERTQHSDEPVRSSWIVD